ncbi:MAG: 2-phosphosulfolactate phosphatase [Bacillota bacterium]|nr:2-phosphosulfolactate phosphatase [Bacillota bacterium]
MQVTVLPTYYDLDYLDLTNKTVVVIDVLRATSTIVAALVNGANAIVPLSVPPKSNDIKRLSAEENILFGGEQSCVKIKGFDLGNSPKEYIPEIVKGKKIYFTSTNGAKTINNAVTARELLIGSILNGKATAEKAASLNNGLVLACAGTRGNFSLEDVLGAGMCIHHLQQLTDCHLNDLAHLALKCFQANSHQLPLLFSHSSAGDRLVRLKLEEDIKFCSQLNLYAQVPTYQKGLITL